jgi:uridine kinase
MTYMVGIAGGSGSGKGTIAALIRVNLESFGLTAHVLCTDNCYKDLSDLNEDERKARCFDIDNNFDHPRAIDFARLLNLTSKLKRGEAFNYKTYNFLTQSYDDNSKKLNVRATLDVAIVEGIYALYNGSDVGTKTNRELIDLYDVSYFVTTSPVTATIRRIKRDIVERGCEVMDVLEQKEKTVNPMYNRFVFPTRIFADDTIRWDNNPTCDVDVLKKN